MLLPKNDLGDLGGHGVRYINLSILYIMEKPNYKKAYQILEDFFDYIPEDLRAEVSKKLDRCGV